MRTISGFVYQVDLFVPTLTVFEHLHLAARLKLDRRTTAEVRRKLVDEILRDVGLTKCANRFIGTSSEEDGKLNLSGGERKRLSVATELLINPALLFCDEPTTGLDSFTALKVMTIMKKMTEQRGKTIICSIHQPSEKILNLFHQIILLYDGNVAFSGTTGDALEFFQSIGYYYNKEQNPGDYLVKSVSVVPGCESESIDKVAEICYKFERSRYAKYVYERIELETKQTEKLDRLEKIDHISWLFKFYLITYREVLNSIRDSSIQYILILKRVVIAVLIGASLRKPEILDQASVQSMKGILFVCGNQNFLPSLYVALNHFPRKMPMFMREYSNNMNTPLIFYLSNFISLIPGLLFDPILFTVIAYSLLGLPNNWFAVLVIMTVNILVFFTSASYGILVSLLAPNNLTIAETFILMVRTFFYIFCGVVMNIRTIPVIFLWIRYTSWVTYAFECVMIVYFEDVKYIRCSKAADVPCLRNGQEVLNSIGFDSDNLQRNVIIMCCIYLVLHLLSFITLRIKLYLGR
ncbi:protein scarlet-like isoform X2 [Planococcus citri]